MSALGGRPRSVALCGIQFLPHRSTAISNWQLLIQTACGQLLFRAAAFLAAGSRRKSRRALNCVRRIGAIGLPTRTLSAPLFCSQFCPHVAFSWQEGVAPRQKNRPERGPLPDCPQLPTWRTFDPFRLMSAIGGKADIMQTCGHVCF